MNVFDSDIFHMGGDEVDLRCYNSSEPITTYMEEKNYARDVEGFMQLWNEFQEKGFSKSSNI